MSRTTPPELNLDCTQNPYFSPNFLFHALCHVSKKKSQNSQLSWLTVPSNLPRTNSQEIHDVHFQRISGMSFLISIVAPVQTSISSQLNKFIPPPQHAVFLIQQPKFSDKVSRLSHFHTWSSKVLQSFSPTALHLSYCIPSPQISIDADADDADRTMFFLGALIWLLF